MVIRTQHAKGYTTRERIIEAALDHFARDGFAGASLTDIAGAAGVSRPLLLHHFSSKQQLWEATRLQCALLFKNKYVPQFLEAQDRPDVIYRMLLAWLRFFRENPRMQKIGLWAHARGEVLSWPGEQESLVKMRQILEHAQVRGLVRDDIRAIDLLIFAIGSIYFWILNSRRFYSDSGLLAKDVTRDQNFVKELVVLLGVEGSASL